MKEHISFRTSFNGFNRDDVVSYISDLMEKKDLDAITTTEIQGMICFRMFRIASVNCVFVIISVFAASGRQPFRKRPCAFPSVR